MCPARSTEVRTVQDREEHQLVELPSEPRPHLGVISWHGAAAGTETELMLKAARLDKHGVISPGGETFGHITSSFLSDETTPSCVSAPFLCLHSSYAAKIVSKNTEAIFLKMSMY